jgi:replication factor A1
VLKTANKKFTNIKNDYEMTFTSDTQVLACNEDTTDIPTLTFDFTPISTMAGLENNAIIG